MALIKISTTQYTAVQRNRINHLSHMYILKDGKWVDVLEFRVKDKTFEQFTTIKFDVPQEFLGDMTEVSFTNEIHKSISMSI